MSTKASYFFKDDFKELTRLLDDAERNATTDKQIHFVSQMVEDAEKFGLAMYMSKAQYDYLVAIAGY